MTEQAPPTPPFPLEQVMTARHGDRPTGKPPATLVEDLVAHGDFISLGAAKGEVVQVVSLIITPSGGLMTRVSGFRDTVDLMGTVELGWGILKRNLINGAG